MFRDLLPILAKPGSRRCRRTHCRDSLVGSTDSLGGFSLVAAQGATAGAADAEVRCEDVLLWCGAAVDASMRRLGGAENGQLQFAGKNRLIEGELYLEEHRLILRSGWGMSLMLEEVCEARCAAG